MWGILPNRSIFMPGQAGRRPTVAEQNVIQHLICSLKYNLVVQPCFYLLINTNGPWTHAAFCFKVPTVLWKKMKTSRFGRTLGLNAATAGHWKSTDTGLLIQKNIAQHCTLPQFTRAHETASTALHLLSKLITFHWSVSVLRQLPTHWGKRR